MGYISLIIGCMFSQKTTELLRRVRRYKSIGYKVLVVNYIGDNRYGKDCVSSHDKDVEKAAEEFAETEEILPRFDPKSDKPEDTVLVRMTRENHRYDIAGYTFTKEHPFVAMTEDDAQKIFDKEEGFRIATPKEVQDYYA
jgi:hypothetical protein